MPNFVHGTSKTLGPGCRGWHWLKNLLVLFFFFFFFLAPFFLPLFTRQHNIYCYFFPWSNANEDSQSRGANSVPVFGDTASPNVVMLNKEQRRETTLIRAAPLRRLSHSCLCEPRDPPPSRDPPIPLPICALTTGWLVLTWLSPVVVKVKGKRRETLSGAY